MIISWIGLILGIGGVILGQMLEGGHIEQLLQPTAALIVFGGTLGATMLSSTVYDFSHAIRALPRLFLGKNPDYIPTIKEIIQLATIARRDGILGLEGSVNKIKNPFFQNNLRHVIDGYDPQVLKEMMETRIYKEEEEKIAVSAVWLTAGGFSPTVGIIGAVLGLIHVMSNLSDSSKLGAGIAVAFVATVYGVGSANLFFIPVANKLKKLAKLEVLELEVIMEGLAGLQAGLNPRVIEDRLYNLIGESGAPANEGRGNFERKAA